MDGLSSYCCRTVLAFSLLFSSSFCTARRGLVELKVRA